MTDATTTSGLLVFEADEQRQNEFKIDFRKPPSDWKKALENRSRFKTLSFTDGDRGAKAGVVHPDKVIMELAVALQSYPQHGITKIEFFECQEIPEFGILCSTLMKPLPSTASSRLSLFFLSATIDHRAMKMLCSLLDDNSLDELCLEHCRMDDLSARDLEQSLAAKRSLRYFNCKSNMDKSMRPHFLEMAGIRNTLLLNRSNLVKLHLNIPNKANVWSIFRAATQGHRMSVLQHLQFCDSRIPLRAMEALMMMSWMVHSLQILHFTGCKLTSAALLFLNKTLTNQKVLDSLALEYCKTLLPGSKYDNSGKDVSLCVNFGKVQVQKISLQGTKLKPQSFDQMMVDIRNNPFIKFLNVSDGVIDSSDAFDKFNEAILQQSRGPSELVMDGIVDVADTIIEALQHNSNIKVLTIREADDAKDSLIPFVRGLANMHHVCKLTFHFRKHIHVTRKFMQALEHSVERNCSLESLVIGEASIKDELAKLFLPNIRYHLAISRVKRNSLMTEPDVPSGIWAHVLNKTSKERDGIYFVLTGKPDIIIAPTRKKRKERHDDDDE